MEILWIGPYQSQTQYLLYLISLELHENMSDWDGLVVK